MAAKRCVRFRRGTLGIVWMQDALHHKGALPAVAQALELVPLPVVREQGGACQTNGGAGPQGSGS
jgi:hypothetical protein